MHLHDSKPNNDENVKGKGVTLGGFGDDENLKPQEQKQAEYNQMRREIKTIYPVLGDFKGLTVKLIDEDEQLPAHGFVVNEMDGQYTFENITKTTTIQQDTLVLEGNEHDIANFGHVLAFLSYASAHDISTDMYTIDVYPAGTKVPYSSGCLGKGDKYYFFVPDGGNLWYEFLPDGNNTQWNFPVVHLTVKETSKNAKQDQT